jgi:hypothetical protein
LWQKLPSPPQPSNEPLADQFPTCVFPLRPISQPSLIA